MFRRWHKRLLLLSFVLVTSSNVLHNQPLFQLAYAESLSSSNQFAAAITEFKRYVFFNPRDEHLHRAFMGLGNCYREEGDLDRAINYFQISLTDAPNDSIYDTISLEIALTYLEAGALDTGLIEVERVLISSSEPQLVKRALFIKFLAL